ncbi:hypothetical protein [Streptomyces sp. PT12]|uniref:hypothetical protein n=1 Tax=Streptomyces sp. PT12 TaxID=1510197 RepID=UPI000DE23D02|nr:hypothetical protein [Streptomyces sp. PT12]RBM05656.1 hypothetical protein DEH69_28190 [Streptomyces sp. PT12]
MSFGKHTHGPNFGKKVDGCPRCDELKAGAEPVRQEWRGQAARDEEMRRRSHEAHFAPGGPHATGQCGPVCTFGDW